MNERMNVGCTACVIAENKRKKSLAHSLFSWWFFFSLPLSLYFRVFCFIVYNRPKFCCFCWSSVFFLGVFCTWWMHFISLIVFFSFLPSFFHHIDGFIRNFTLMYPTRMMWPAYTIAIDFSFWVPHIISLMHLAKRENISFCNKLRSFI